MTQFVAGYSAIILHLLNTNTRFAHEEIKSRITHLRSLMCFAHVYQWKCILNIRQEILIDIERGNRSWNDSFADIESLNLLLDRTITNSTTRMLTTSTSSEERGWFCSKVQKGECSKTSPHAARKYELSNMFVLLAILKKRCYAITRNLLPHVQTGKTD
ncbi:hypothetical protein DPMN_071185 [Dreissena polymorpha]|uniref:Uncharacterized protein n=1 Tax=Dreissena polymorpha TaxID=45954 RepID=A0A9D3Z6A7_DREPO|nr:hypothetical protein DPMN_071185 [Dreissena polymorpha]